MASRTSLIEKLEKWRGNPVVVVASSWRDDTATDLDAQAGRAFVTLYEELERPDALTLVLAARGGYASFVDSVLRTTRAHGTSLELAVPSLVTGIGGLLALGADRLLVHHHGGVGAYDAGPLVADAQQLDHDLIDDVPALGGISYGHDPALPARLAAGMREQRLARALGERLADDDKRNALSRLRLGTDHGLSAAELTDLGFEVEATDDSALWELFVALEEELGLLTTPQPRYTESDLGDEVEFELATGLVSAIVESRERSMVHELDTGRPDPDTGRYFGGWSF